MTTAHQIPYTVPRLHLIPMTDIDSRETVATTPAPPPSEHATSPDNEVPIPRTAMNPPPRPTADNMLTDCLNQLLEGNESLKRIRHDLLDPEGAFAERQREGRRALILELKEAVVPRVIKLEDTVAEFRRQLESLQADIAKQRAEYEKKFNEQQLCLDVISEMLPELEKVLADARTPETPSPTPG